MKKIKWLLYWYTYNNLLYDQFFLNYTLMILGLINA